MWAREFDKTQSWISITMIISPFMKTLGQPFNEITHSVVNQYSPDLSS